jgi:hypothetical protein
MQHVSLTLSCAVYLIDAPLGQGQAWKAHHRFICRRYSQWTASAEYNGLQAHERLEAVMLSQIAALANTTPSISEGNESMLQTTKSLLPAIAKPAPLPLLLPKNSVLKNEDLYIIHNRFSNNNFVLHSHLTSYAHGVYPLASRIFNHSCLPNAAVKYLISTGSPPTMEIVALRDIRSGEEVCYCLLAILGTDISLTPLDYNTIYRSCIVAGR